MRKLFCLFFTFITLCQSLIASPYKFDLSICMIFQDEAPYLKEWVEFHHLLGVEHFYLYNNNSTDDYLDVLAPYVESGLVELTEWTASAANISEWGQIQISAYNHALDRARITTKWLAIIDSDEFLVPTVENCLSKFLKPYEKRKGLGGLLVNWVCFGTSWVEKIPDDKLLIETLTLCASQGQNQFKSIVMPKKVSYIANPHHVVYKKGYRHFSASGNKPPFLEIDKIRINHYWSRDEWYLNHYKIPRRILWGTDPLTTHDWANANNEDYDSTILRFVEALTKRM